MQCPNCNTQVDNNASFCPNCGYQFNNMNGMSNANNVNNMNNMSMNNMGNMSNINNGMNMNNMGAMNNGMNAPVQPMQPVQQNSNSSSSLLQVAFIFNIITMVSLALVVPVIALMGSAIASFVSVNSGSDTIGIATGGEFSIAWLILCLIPLAWMIPMTIYLSKIRKGQTKITTAYSVCTLLFVNVVSGILLLVEQSHRKR